ncbi:MAG: bifunctional NADP phosphatase/NAD kinase [archaeon]|nr:bifunctional NADP phosphatase/NAD kinase [archaeon]
MEDKDIEMCRTIAKTIFKNVETLLKGQIGNPKAGEFVKIGADGTPTSYIDIIAENEVIKILENAEFTSYLISEEIGELKLGCGKQEHINLKEELKKDIRDQNDAKFIFLIDPLDGTSNAIKNIPSYGMSIAVAEIPYRREATLNDVILGFVKDYANGNYYEAIKGQGATINGEPLNPSKETEIDKITLGGFTKSKTDAVSKLVDTARRMRVLGSVVLELAYVASGKYDSFLDLRGSRIIDIAASKLIVEECGAIVTNRYGEELDNKLSIYEKTVVVAAGNKTLHKKIIKIINNDDLDQIKRVGIVSRVDEYKSILFSLKIFETLLNKGVDLIIESSLAEALDKLKNDPNLNNIVKDTMQATPEIAYYLNDLNWDFDFKKYSVDLNEFNTELVVILGGDGTFLRAQNQIKKQIPIFGINMGTVGFLTEIEVENTFKALDKILEGDCYKENRTQIMVSHENNTFRALNEVVIMTARPAKMLHYEITVDGEVIEELRSDGLIIATPSGSTAYSMSAGGPILDPKVPGFIIIPICPYKLGVRPFVVSNESEIRIRLLKRGKKAIYVMDGQIEQEVNYMEELIFKKSEKEVEFIRLNNKYFYKKVTDKLTIGGIDIINRAL